MTNVLSIAAMILTVKRAIEEWVLWIAVNAIEVFMWYRAWCSGSGNISILLMWMLFLVNGIYLLTLWLRIERRNLKTHAVNDAKN
jgi:nicotinamide mononucleotide transporter